MEETVVEVVNQDVCDDGPIVLSGSLRAVIDSLQSVYESIPEEWRDAARCKFDTYHEYGSDYIFVEIYYTRPATQGEIARREKERAELRERQILARLKAKYKA